MQGRLDCSGRDVALLWDFDNLRPPGGPVGAVAAARALQVQLLPWLSAQLLVLR